AGLYSGRMDYGEAGGVLGIGAVSYFAIRVTSYFLSVVAPRCEANDGCDRSQTTKALTGQRTPKSWLFGVERKTRGGVLRKVWFRFPTGGRWRSESGYDSFLV